MELTAAGHVIELCSLSRPCDRDRVSERPFGVVIPPPSSDMSSPTKEEPTDADGSTRMQQSGSPQPVPAGHDRMFSPSATEYRWRGETRERNRKEGSHDFGDGVPCGTHPSCLAGTMKR